MNKKIRILILLAIIAAWVIAMAPRLMARAQQMMQRPSCPYILTPRVSPAPTLDRDKLFADAFEMLKVRNDQQAMENFKKILAINPDDTDALWGESEVYRRRRQFSEAQDVLERLLKNDPNHAPALINLSYLRYYEDKLDEAKACIDRALASPGIDNDDKALAYMMMGTINSRRSAAGLVSKIKYGMQIKNYFLKANALAPELPEVHLGLGTFYLKAPPVVGGNLDKAIAELETAMKIAPDFATASARLAQAYKKKGDLENYNFFLNKAIQLDPGNEALTEEK